jgi:hypothetical protein
MHDETTRGDAEREAALAENTILHLMLDDPAPAPWSVNELRAAHGCPLRADEAIAALHAAGLIHLAAGYAWPTRAAAAAARVENAL